MVVELRAGEMLWDVTARYELLSMLCDLVLATATARRLLDDRSARVEAICALVRGDSNVNLSTLFASVLLR